MSQERLRFEPDARTGSGADTTPAGLDDVENSAIPIMLEIADSVPAAYRQAYMDGAAGVLGGISVAES